MPPKGNNMSNKKMSTPYLLTLIDDRIKEVGKLIKKLKKQDCECGMWNDASMDSLKENFKWFTEKIVARRSELLPAKGIDPALLNG